VRSGHHATRTVRRVLQALLVVALLAIILNPELRALVLLTNALGLEITLILIALQWRALLIAAAPGLRGCAVLACGAASRLGYLALRAYPPAVSMHLFSRLLCPALITVSYGLSCRTSRIRATDRYFG
jgi:hypothetical protein